MTEDEMKAFMDAITALRDDVLAQVGKIDAKCNAMADSVAKMKADAGFEIALEGSGLGRVWQQAPLVAR